MPESAEVKLTTEYLKYKLYNKFIFDWIFLKDSQYGDKYPKGFEEFKSRLPFIIENVQCKGKFIYFTLFNEHGYFYILHSLRMTGKWQDYRDKYCRWYIESEDEKLWFSNSRCLATLEFTSKLSVLQEELNKLGPDILTDEINLPTWNNLINKHAKKNITTFLMNQSIISGVGNYIKAEALYYSKISPLRKTGSLTKKESEKLFEGIRIIPRIAYNKNGLDLKDYTYKNDSHGHELKIYSKSHAKRTKTADGRITYWDPNVQM